MKLLFVCLVLLPFVWSTPVFEFLSWKAMTCNDPVFVQFNADICYPTSVNINGGDYQGFFGSSTEVQNSYFQGWFTLSKNCSDRAFQLIFSNTHCNGIPIEWLNQNDFDTYCYKTNYYNPFLGTTDPL